MLLAAFALLVLAGGARSQTDCFSLPGKKETVYIGWPLSVSCADGWDYDLYIFGDLVCEIRDGHTGNVLHSCATDDYFEHECSTYDLGDVTENSTTLLEIVLKESNSSSCSSLKITYDVQPTPSATCEDFIQGVQYEFPTVNGTGKEYSCDAPSGTQSIEGLPVKWFRNCGELPPDAKIIEDMMTIGAVNYATDAGVYSCAVEHNGLLRHVAYHVLCIKPPSVKDQISLKCDKTEHQLSVGDTASFDCTVDAGQGVLNSNAYTMTFNRIHENGSVIMSKDNISCTSTLGGNETFAPDRRVSCKFEYKNHDGEELKCFQKIPTQQEWEAETKRTTKLTMTYRLENIQEEDFGEFRAFVRQSADMDINSSQIITIEEDVQHPEREFPIYVICICVVALLMIIVGIVFILRTELQWCWKHNFENPGPVMREHDAYLAYYWSSNPGEAVAQRNYDSLIEQLKASIVSLNCNYYDNAEDIGITALQFENIRKMRDSCERIIVILTAEYLQDERSTFEIYQQYLDNTFVFIETPGVRRAIKFLPDEKRCGIKSALRHHRVIRWDGHSGKLSSRFKMQLELHMPKRKPGNRRMTGLTYANGQGRNGFNNHEAMRNGFTTAEHVEIHMNGHHGNGNGAVGNGNGTLNGYYENGTFH